MNLQRSEFHVQVDFSGHPLLVLFGQDRADQSQENTHKLAQSCGDRVGTCNPLHLKISFIASDFIKAFFNLLRTNARALSELSDIVTCD